MRIALLINNVVETIYKQDNFVGYSEPFEEIDITNYSGAVEIGYIYHPESQTFIVGEVKTPAPELIPEPTIEEKILAENQYQTMLLELSTVGGA